MSEKSDIISIFEGYEKKERKKGAQKKGGENSPISPPLDPRLCMSFRFVSKQRKTSDAGVGDVFFDILATSKGASALGMF